MIAEPPQIALGDAIQDRLAGPLFHPEELIELVGFHADVFAGLQRHDDELAIPGGVEHLPEIRILDSQ